MTKILAGVIAVLVLALSLGGWLLKRQIEETASQKDAADKWEQQATGLQKDVEDANRRNDALNTTVKTLAAKKAASDATARAKARELDNLKQTTGDSNESFSCLDLPVPTELDRSLRVQPDQAGGANAVRGAAR